MGLCPERPSNLKTCICYLPLPLLLVLPRPCRWYTIPPSTSPQTRCSSECPASFHKASKAPSDLSDRVTSQQTRRPPDTAYGAAPVGRVKIQTYRGPSKGDYDFAPWGYYNTQPADLQIHH